jgi:hypothetical protein
MVRSFRRKPRWISSGRSTTNCSRGAGISDSSSTLVRTGIGATMGTPDEGVTRLEPICGIWISRDADEVLS